MTPWLLLLLPLIALLAWMRFEAGWLEVCRVPVQGGPGLRIAVISDLHPAYCRVRATRARAAVLAENVDLLLFLGDAADNARQIDQSAAWLGTCTRGIPTMAVLGNHDHKLFSAHPDLLPAYRNALAGAGIRLCVDERITFTADGRTVLLTALDDYRQPRGTASGLHAGTSRPVGHPAPPFSAHDDTRTQVPPATPIVSPPPGPSVPDSTEKAFHLVFTHNPQRIAELPHGYADFAVAGHFHGGQIWMPFGLEFRLFRKEPLGRAGVRRGGHQVNGMPVYLTRGIGNVLFPLRLGARPEITILEL